MHFYKEIGVEFKLEVILTALGVYIATSIDYLFILTIIFAQLDNPSQKSHIYAGQYIGTGILVGISLVATYIVNFIPADWIIGLLGLIPIILGIRMAIIGEEDEDEEKIIEKMNQSHSTQLFWVVTLLTIVSGGDNVGIYTSYFSSLNWSQIVLALIVFAFGIIALVEISRLLSSTAMVSETIEKYERIIVPVVFIALGIYIMIENGTIQTMFNFLF